MQSWVSAYVELIPTKATRFHNSMVTIMYNTCVTATIVAAPIRLQYFFYSISLTAFWCVTYMKMAARKVMLTLSHSIVECCTQVG